MQRDIFETMGISNKVLDFSDEILKSLQERFKKIDEIAEYNQLKVLYAMQKNKVSDVHFAATNGYGYTDLGRDTLEQVYADIFHTEDALVRPQIVSGTHALSVAMAGNLHPGDEMISVSGKPYDTLEEVIGIIPSRGSLTDNGVIYKQVDLILDNVSEEDLKKGYKCSFDYDGIKKAITSKTKMCILQRSKGYQTRPSFSVEQIGEVISYIKNIREDIIIMVDNCYGEFVETIEPSDVGADMVVGSLIKNPGGGLAPTGGYIAGKRQCIENAAFRLTCPGLGKEVGCTLGVMQNFYQGLFLAPTVTASALKGAIFAANIYEKLGFPVVPSASEDRFDIIQAVTFGTAEGVIEFCKAIQSAAPVDSFVSPEPWDMPGYDSPVIMAAGAFVSGSSIELSADAPIKEPYAVYFQGGLTFPHAKFGIMKSLQQLIDKNIVTL